MKKKSYKKKLKAAFWVVFLLAAGWVAFVPHTKVSAPPSITVKVQQPPLIAETPSANEPTAPSNQPPAGEETPQMPPLQNGSVTVPVVTETPEKPPSGKLAKIAIVIDDLGPDMKGSERAIRLPAPITLSFLPYAVRVREQAKEARDLGHEILLHMPMEPVGGENPGKGALLVDLPLRDIQERFQTALASFTGFDGVNNHMGSKFTAYAEGMNLVVDELKQRQLFLFDSRTGTQSVAIKLAEQKGVPSISRDIFLDDNTSPEAIRKQLDATVRLAQRKGYAVAIGHPHATTLDIQNQAISEGMITMREDGFLKALAGMTTIEEVVSKAAEN